MYIQINPGRFFYEMNCARSNWFVQCNISARCDWSTNLEMSWTGHLMRLRYCYIIAFESPADSVFYWSHAILNDLIGPFSALKNCDWSIYFEMLWTGHLMRLRHCSIIAFKSHAKTALYWSHAILSDLIGPFSALWKLWLVNKFWNVVNSPFKSFTLLFYYCV